MAPPTEAESQSLVVFTPSGLRGRFPSGTTVLDAARSLGVDLDSVCGGRGICGRCQVVPTEGEFAKHGISSSLDHLTPFGADEEDYAARKGLATGRRLGCSAHITGDLVLDVPEESQVHRQVVRKRLEVADFVVDPVLRLHYVEVERPAMDSPSGDVSRLLAALEDQWDLRDISVSLSTMAAIQHALRAGEWAVTVAIRDESTLAAIWPGFHEGVLGIAIDIGSTTLAGHICDLTTGKVLASAGRMNPQIRFGEDLMSRVSYVMMNPDGANQLTAAVRDALDDLVSQLVKEVSLDRNDVLELTLVGNPIMHHLLLGLDARPLGEAPFALATDAAISVAASEIGIAVHPGARAYVLPCIAGHVGADAAAAILSEAPHRQDEIELLVDVGTNAEIILGNRTRLLAASSPTGPAFEGAQISSGQRAAPGAIERVRIDRSTLEPRYKVIGSELWSDEGGFTEDIAVSGVTGICGSGIIEVVAELFLAGVITADGRIDGSAAARSSRIVADGPTFAYVMKDDGPRILITQLDVRAIQLAKAALYAGVRLLMDHLGVDAVDQIRLAGAFGSHIDVRYAMVLGLIPDCDLERVTSAGNAAGTGAMIALLDRKARSEIEKVVSSVEKIETAMEPSFQAHFVDAMALPHKTAAYPNLTKVMELPERSPTDIEQPRGRRARRRSAPVEPVNGVGQAKEDAADVEDPT